MLMFASKPDIIPCSHEQTCELSIHDRQVCYYTTYLLPDLLKADHICLKMRVDVKIVKSEKVKDRFQQNCLKPR